MVPVQDDYDMKINDIHIRLTDIELVYPSMPINSLAPSPYRRPVVCSVQCKIDYLTTMSPLADRERSRVAPIKDIVTAIVHEYDVIEVHERILLGIPTPTCISGDTPRSRWNSFKRRNVSICRAENSALTSSQYVFMKASYAARSKGMLGAIVVQIDISGPL